MTFKRAIVTAVAPLRILIDGDTVPIPFTPKSLIDPATLAVDDVVHADQSGHRLLVLGRVGGLETQPAEVLLYHNEVGSTSSLPIDGVFSPSKYVNYRFVYRLTASSAINMRFRTSSPSDASSSNSYKRLRTYMHSAGTVTDATDGDAYPIANAAPGDDLSGEYLLFSPAHAKQTLLTGQATEDKSVFYGITISGRHNVATAYAGLRLFCASATMSGEVWLYGQTGA